MQKNNRIHGDHISRKVEAKHASSEQPQKAALTNIHSASEYRIEKLKTRNYIRKIELFIILLGAVLFFIVYRSNLPKGTNWRKKIFLE